MNCNKAKFKNILKLVTPFSATNSMNRNVPVSNSKKRKAREFCNFCFCLENGFSTTFDNEPQLE